MSRAWVQEAGPLAPGRAEARVTWDNFDAERLAIGVFAETNRVRRAHGLAPLRPYPHLREAADLQAFSNAITGTVSHDGLFAGRANAWERVRAQGIQPELVLENVLSNLVRTAPSGGAVRIVMRADGSADRREDATGAELPWPTYRELAQRIVQQWMESPGHRANLLNPRVTRLACGTALSRSPLGGELVHAAQVFVALPRSR